MKISGPDFDEHLSKAKMITGRRYNPEQKVWEFPNDPDTLLKVVFTIEPELPVELRDRVKSTKQEITTELLTKLPNDATLQVPWADRLAPKQRSGVEFMVNHPRCLLCDEMGGGKTVQSLTTVYESAWRAAVGNLEGAGGFTAVPQVPRVLVIAPNTVTGHWQNELKKWSDTPSTIIDGSAEQRKAQLSEALEKGEWVIVNWEKLRLMPELADVTWDAVIADEVHRAKNRKAQVTKALWKIHAPIQLALTGTPILNDPGDLWAVLKWLRPEQYTSFWQFFEQYAEYYSGFKGKPLVVGVKNADSLRFELSDKMVRRTKREIHEDIPEPFPPMERDIPMKPKQKAIYDEALHDFWLEIAQEATAKDTNADDSTKEGVQAALEAGDIETLKLMIPNAASRLVRLRQIATSPALLGGPDESGKLDAIMETITDAEADRPFVVFFWFKEAVRIFLDRLDAKGISAQGFTGDTPREERLEIAEAFQNEEFQVIVPTIASGREGINLFRSSDPLLGEQDWVPALNQQAIDRCDRKGQTNSVQAQLFRSANSVETGRIAPKNRTKQMIVATILGEQ